VEKNVSIGARRRGKEKEKAENLKGVPGPRLDIMNIHGSGKRSGGPKVKRGGKVG